MEILCGGGKNKNWNGKLSSANTRCRTAIDGTTLLYQLSRRQEHTERADIRWAHAKHAHLYRDIKKGKHNTLRNKLAICKLNNKLQHFLHSLS